MNAETLLIIGNKNYSSWSLRAWLAARRSGVPFSELRLSLDTPEFVRDIGEYSPTGQVPVLIHHGVKIWDSLAIAEYLADIYPGARMWPEDAAERAHARAISAEMHSGFRHLRAELPMNCRATGRSVRRSPGCDADIARIRAMWRECRAAHDSRGPWLFGDFTIADMMYAPVASRFHTYGVSLDPVCAAYRDAVLAWPAVQDWIADARAEKEVLEHDEVGA